MLDHETEKETGLLKSEILSNFQNKNLFFKVDSKKIVWSSISKTI